MLRAYVRTPQHPAKYRVIRWLSHYCFPSEGIPDVVAAGIKLYLHPRDWIEYLLLQGQEYEPATLNWLRRNLHSGDTAVLAGINMGLHVAVAAESTGKAGRVIGVDPQPGALLRTAVNLQINGLLDRVRLLSAALGREENILPMAWADQSGNAGAASFYDTGEGLHVTLTTLDRLAKHLRLNPWRFLLLDVEGYEPQVLEGLSPAHAPEMMIVEIQPPLLARAGTSPAALLNQLRTFRYDLFDLHGNPVETSQTQLPESNVVCVRPGTEVDWVPKKLAPGRRM